MSAPGHDLLQNLVTRLIGSEPVSRLLITGLLADGHVLIQGPPGIGKTSLARTLADSIGATFKRIQFTPDLLPSDLIGCSVYDPVARAFHFHPGPLFGHIVLADEINRAGPRTQSALLEAMNERQISVDGVTHPLEKPFFVVATENHLSSAGTFPLPDSQLDRFLLSFEMPSPDESMRADILAFHAGQESEPRIQPVMSRDDLLAAQADVRLVRVAPGIIRYIARLCEAVQARKEFSSPVSSRASLAVMAAARAWAAQEDRDAVYPEDVKAVLSPVLRHRLFLSVFETHGIRRIEAILREVLDTTEVPMHE